MTDFYLVDKTMSDKRFVNGKGSEQVKAISLVHTDGPRVYNKGRRQLIKEEQYFHV